MPESPKVDYSVFKYILEKCFPCGVKTDDLFSFFDEYDILLGSYPKYYENNLYFVAFAKSIHSMKIRNDLPNRNLANEKAVEYGFELLNEKLKLIDMNWRKNNHINNHINFTNMI